MNRAFIAALLLFVLVSGAWAQPAPTSPVFTLDPVMTKGAAGAPVTIVEFSDYQ
jgi:protein-disulfide isomerase